MVFQLVYVSKAATDMDDCALDEILSTARCNNSGQQISGMLLYHNGSFIQVLEGEEPAVERLFEKSARMIGTPAPASCCALK